jgi:hypothetical protein
MSKYIGDFSKNDTITFMFTTFRPSTGAPFLLAGTPVVSVYKDNNTTQDTAGVTLTTNYDAVTGLNFVSISTSGAFYVDGSSYECVITTGTVDSVSVVGSCVGRFTMRDQACLYPTTSGRTLDVSTGGEAGVDLANVGSPTTTLALTGTTISTSQQVASVSGSVGSVASGGITATSIATGAIDADALATDAVDEIADGILNRNIAGGSSSGRLVKDAFRAIRNKSVVSAGTLTVYQEDDTTSAWTATVGSDPTAEPIISIDPA